MKEIKSGRGKFAQFKDNEPRCRELAEAIIGTFKRSAISPFGSMVRLADLRRFNLEHQRCLNHYALNIYGCMSLIKQHFRTALVGDSVAQMNIDKSGDGTGPAAELARHYACTDPHIDDIAKYIHPYPMPEGKMRCMPALQAADFVAWEARKYVEQHRDFWDERPDGETTHDLRKARTERAVKEGTESPFLRGSWRVFMQGSPALLVTWTYNVLCLCDDARGGVWSAGDRKRDGGSSVTRSS